MAITTGTYGPFGKHLLNGAIATATAELMVTLHSASYTPDVDHEFYSLAEASEVVGPGYTAGGVLLANVTNTYDAANNRTNVDADDVTWLGLDLTFRYALVRAKKSSAATSPLMMWIDFGADQVVGGSDLTLQWQSSGLYRLTA